MNETQTQTNDYAEEKDEASQAQEAPEESRTNSQEGGQDKAQQTQNGGSSGQSTDRPSSSATKGSRDQRAGAQKSPENKSGKKRKPAKSEYGRQLAQKQEVRDSYNLSEHQFAAYVNKATATSGVDPKNFLYQLLETRLDSVVYLLGLSGFSRKLARQIVSHGHILVDGRRVTIPSYPLVKGQAIAIRPQSLETKLLRENLASLVEENMTPPSWIRFDYQKGAGEIKGMPQWKDSTEALDLTAVIEFYSR